MNERKFKIVMKMLTEWMEDAIREAMEEQYRDGFDEGWAHGLNERGIVFCHECRKKHGVDGKLVCTRFRCFNHETKPDGFCHEGVRA